MNEHPILERLSRVAGVLIGCILLGMVFNIFWNLFVFLGGRRWYRYLGFTLLDGFIGFLAFGGFVLPLGFGAAYHPLIGVAVALVLWPATFVCMHRETKVYIHRKLQRLYYLRALNQGHP